MCSTKHVFLCQEVTWQILIFLRFNGAHVTTYHKMVHRVSVRINGNDQDALQDLCKPVISLGRGFEKKG